MPNDYKKFREKLMFIVKILLHSMTIFEIEEEVQFFSKYWYLLITFVTSILMIWGETSFFLQATTNYERFLAMQSMGAVFSSNSIFFASQFRSKCLVDIYFMIKNGIWKKGLSHHLEITNEDVYKRCISWSYRYGRLIIAFAFNTILSSVPFAILTQEYYSKDGMTLIYASGYFWNYDTFFTYVLTYTLQVISVYPVFFVFWGNMAFIAITVIIFQHQTDELVNLIKTLDFSEHDEIKNPSKWNQHYGEHLKECIQLHQKMRSHFRNFKSWFGIIFSAEIAYITVEVGILSFLVLKEEQTYGTAMKLIFFVSVLLAQLFFHCNVGEKLYEMNDIITGALNDLVFEVKNKKIRRLVMMFIQQTQIPYELTGFNTFRTSFQVFTKLIRTSYSFLNVLRTSSK